MICPRCGVENEDTRAACWNCFGQLRTAGNVKAQKAAPPPKPAKVDRKKGKKGAPVEAPVIQPAAPPVVAAPPMAPAPAAPSSLDIPPITAGLRDEVAPLAEEAEASLGAVEPQETAFIAGIPMGVGSEMQPEPAVPLTVEVPAADASADEEIEADGRKVLDLDAPIPEAPYVIPGLADEDAKPTAEAAPDLGGVVFDLDSDEPGEKKPHTKGK